MYQGQDPQTHHRNAPRPRRGRRPGAGVGALVAVAAVGLLAAAPPVAVGAANDR